MITRLAHVNLMSNDLAASQHFYCDILGLKKGFEFYKDGKLFGFYLETGDTTFIEIFTQDPLSDEQRPLINHLCLEVADLDAVIESIRATGWTITDKKRGCDQSWQAWITDPCGVRIELMQYTEQSSQFTSQPCQVNW